MKPCRSDERMETRDCVKASLGKNWMLAMAESWIHSKAPGKLRAAKVGRGVPSTAGKEVVQGRKLGLNSRE